MYRRPAHLIIGLGLITGACSVGAPNEAPAPATADHAAAQLVQGLSVSNGNRYDADALATGKAVYADRQYVFTKVPASLEGATYIRTSNNDKLVKEANHLSFTLASAATIFVAYDARAKQLPQWLEGWQLTDEALATNDVAHKLYKKSFPAGKVVLGGNSGETTGAESNYSVIVRPNS